MSPVWFLLKFKLVSQFCFFLMLFCLWVLIVIKVCWCQLILLFALSCSFTFDRCRWPSNATLFKQDFETISKFLSTEHGISKISSSFVRQLSKNLEELVRNIICKRRLLSLLLDINHFHHLQQKYERSDNINFSNYQSQFISGNKIRGQDYIFLFVFLCKWSVGSSLLKNTWKITLWTLPYWKFNPW